MRRSISYVALLIIQSSNVFGQTPRLEQWAFQDSCPSFNNVHIGAPAESSYFHSQLRCTVDPAEPANIIASSYYEGPYTAVNNPHAR